MEAGGWTEQDLNTYKTDGLLKSPFGINDRKDLVLIWLLRGEDRSGRNDFRVGHGEDYALVPRTSDEEGSEPE